MSVCPIYGCPSGPSIRQPVSRCLAGYRDIFGVRYFALDWGLDPFLPFAFPTPPPPFFPRGASNSSHVAAARIAADFTPHPAPRLVRGTLFLDATVPFAGPTRAWGDSVTVDGLTGACARVGALRGMRLRSVTVRWRSQQIKGRMNEGVSEDSKQRRRGARERESSDSRRWKWYYSIHFSVKFASLSACPSAGVWQERYGLSSSLQPPPAPSYSRTNTHTLFPETKTRRIFQLGDGSPHPPS